MLSMLPLSSMIFGITGIDNSITSDILDPPLALCGTTISILNRSTKIKMTKVLFLVTIQALIVCRNSHENLELHDTNSTRSRDTVTGCDFTKKGFLR